MADYKYPYIPKQLYPAVMYACSLIRKYGTFNTACRTAASRYDVDEDEVVKHVRARQSAGQKGTTRKYKFFAVVGWYDRWVQAYDVDLLWSQYDPDEWDAEKYVVGKVIKATSVDNMKKQIPNGKLDRDYRCCGEVWTSVQYKEFLTEKEAQEGLQKLTDSLKQEAYT